MHNHTHQSCCTHPNLKYCPVCCRPYCVDCGKEWFNYYCSYYPTSWTYTDQQPLTSGYGTTTVAPESTCCNHV